MEDAVKKIDPPKMGDDRKKAIAALIIAGKPAEKEEPKDEAAEEKAVMAGEVMDALKSGNTQAFTEALSSMIEYCMSKY